MKTKYNYVDYTELSDKEYSEQVQASIDSLYDVRESLDDINIYFKKIIEDRLIKDPRVIYLLNNDDLNPLEPDTYLGVSILPYVRVPETQDKVKNYVCYIVNMNDNTRIYNEAMMRIYITFTVFCEERNINTEFGICRHDLLGYVLKDDFLWSDMFPGGQVHLDDDQESVTDNHFSVHTLRFGLTLPKNIIQTVDGRTTIKKGQIETVQDILGG